MATKALSPEQKTLRAAQRANARNHAALDQSGTNDPSVARPSRDGGTVTVACKIDLPWIDLQLCEAHEVYENTQTGPRKIKEYRRVGDVVRIRGMAHPVGIAPKGFPKPPEIVAGAALTPGVSANFWRAWLAQHQQDAFVKNGLIFASENRDMVIGQAKETEKIRSGFQAIDPDGDPRVARSMHKDVVGIETDDRMKDSGRHAVT